jgi:hypothetical protein
MASHNKTQNFIPFEWSMWLGVGLPDDFHIFRPKIPIWANFGGPWNGKGWYIMYMTIWNILQPFQIYYDHFKYITTIWYNLWHFGNLEAIWYIFPRFGIMCPEKSGNLDSEWLLASTKWNSNFIRDISSLINIELFYHVRCTVGTHPPQELEDPGSNPARILRAT